MMIHNHRDLDAICAYAERVGAGFQASPTIMAKKDGDLATLKLRVPQQQLIPHFGGPHLGCMSPQAAAQGDGPLCAAASRYCNITSSGDVMACNILPGSDANVRQRSFRDVWENSPWLKQVRAICRRDLHTCNSCSRLPYCGRCHAQALAEDGDLYGPSSYARRRALQLMALARPEGFEERLLRLHEEDEDPRTRAAIIPAVQDPNDDAMAAFLVARARRGREGERMEAMSFLVIRAGRDDGAGPAGHRR